MWVDDKPLYIRFKKAPYIHETSRFIIISTDLWLMIYSYNDQVLVDLFRKLLTLRDCSHTSLPTSLIDSRS